MEINELAKALIAFQSEVKMPGMNSTNPFFKSKYADLKSVIETARPVLSKHGLAFVQLVNKDETGGIIETMLIHESGQYLKSDTHYPINGKPQEQGSAISYMRRYALCAILGLVGDPDDDGEGAMKIESPLHGALEEEMRSKDISFKDKGESKALCSKYETELAKFDNVTPTAEAKKQLEKVLDDLKNDWDKLLNNEKQKLKKIKDQLVEDWEIG